MGAIDGIPVGVFTGTELGLKFAFFVGVIEGLVVGVMAGTAVGLKLGWVVGAVDGIPVGVIEGTAVGSLAAGATVGAFVTEKLKSQKQNE